MYLSLFPLSLFPKLNLSVPMALHGAWVTAYAVINADWNLLLIPALVIIAWSLVSGVSNTFG